MRRNAPQRHTAIRDAFTLVEMLVAMTIVATLMSLTLMAVNHARESARQTQCANRMRNLALAATQYEVAHQQYPGYLHKFGRWQLPLGVAATDRSTIDAAISLPDPSNPANTIQVPHEKLGTWAVTLLPYLDAQPTFEIWTDDRYPLLSNQLTELLQYNPLAVPNLDIFQCPSDGTSDGGSGTNSYVTNNGYVDPSGGVDRAQFADSMKRANGIFNNKYAGLDVLPVAGQTPVPLDAPLGPDVRGDHIRDGLGNTLLVSENLQAVAWHRVGLANLETQALIAPALHLNAAQARGYQGMVWQRYDDNSSDPSLLPPLPARINGEPAVNLVDELLPRTFSFDHARPSSHHRDGVNAATADGAIRFIRDTVDYRVYQALLTPHGKASDVPFPEFVLDPAELQ